MRSMLLSFAFVKRTGGRSVVSLPATRQLGWLVATAVLGMSLLQGQAHGQPASPRSQAPAPASSAAPYASSAPSVPGTAPRLGAPAPAMVPTAPADVFKAPLPQVTASSPASATVAASAASTSAAPAPVDDQPSGEVSPKTVTAPAPSEEAAPASLPRDLTPYGMFMSADVIVKAVMLGLIFASILTWTICLAKAIELFGVRRRLARAQRTLSAARSLVEAAKAASVASPHVALLIRAVDSELRHSPDIRDTEGIKERLTARFERIESGVGRRLTRATGILATIGATAPFVGLFGTVWGIMNSFIGISKLHTTNLAVVAPGIAEALLATAFGLAAAIPAVMIYNVFARAIANYRALYADASVEVLTMVSRDLSHYPPAQAGPFEQRRMTASAAE